MGDLGLWGAAGDHRLNSPRQRERPFCTALFGIGFLAPGRNRASSHIGSSSGGGSRSRSSGSSGIGSHGGSSIVLMTITILYNHYYSAATSTTGGYYIHDPGASSASRTWLQDARVGQCAANEGQRGCKGGYKAQETVQPQIWAGKHVKQCHDK